MCDVKWICFNAESTENYCPTLQLYRSFLPLFSSVFWFNGPVYGSVSPFTAFPPTNKHTSKQAQINPL